VHVTNLLLDEGADENAEGGIALRAASRRGHEAVVLVLLDRGAIV
jgi:ankyrin repeat protein